MRHLGDITKISGYSAPIVDCVIGGSPCQDLSVAGKRAGLDGERSGLYIEQVRIVKEMRERDERNGRTGVDVRPRYMVWENVPGAFSSNKGDDFRIVLEEIAKVCDKDAVIPMPDKGKWTNHGCILGDGWSVAWRVLDAQFWGVPQRRRRITLVADFGGHSAPEILFVRESVSGNTDEGKQTRKAAPTDASGSIGADDCIGVDIYNTAITGNKAKTLNSAATDSDHIPCVLEPVGAFCPETGEKDSSRSIAFQEGLSPTLRSGFTPATVYAHDRASFNQGKNAQYDFEISDKGINSSLVAKGPSAVCYSIDQGGGKSSVDVREDKAPTLTTTHDGAPAVCYSFDPGASRDVGVLFIEGCAKTLANGTCPGHHDGVVIASKARYIVRRLTPLECERLQGYPDGWTDIGEWTDSNGKKRQTSDAARYKALGNSIALPPWKWVLKRLCACYERDATMASLFDGIGGFPYLWEQLNGKGTCLWASEIEEFPMAVTKVRIGE